MMRVKHDQMDFTALARLLHVDETEAEARYEQWLTDNGYREMDEFFRGLE